MRVRKAHLGIVTAVVFSQDSRLLTVMHNFIIKKWTPYPRGEQIQILFLFLFFQVFDISIIWFDCTCDTCWEQNEKRYFDHQFPGSSVDEKGFHIFVWSDCHIIVLDRLECLADHFCYFGGHDGLLLYKPEGGSERMGYLMMPS